MRFAPQKTPNSCRAFLIALAGITSLAVSAGAQITTFSSRALFDAAIAAVSQSVDFEGLVPSGSGASYYNSGGGSKLIDGVTFSSPAPNAFFVLNQPSNTFYNRGTGALASAQGTPTLTTLTMSVGSLATAFGVDLGTGDGLQRIFSVALSNGETTSFTNSGGQSSLDFFGFTTNTPFSSVTLSVSDIAPLYDNVTFGNATASVTTTPEPASVALMATGLVGVAGWTSRRKGRRI